MFRTVSLMKQLMLVNMDRERRKVSQINTLEEYYVIIDFKRAMVQMLLKFGNIKFSLEAFKSSVPLCRYVPQYMP
jgi:hypothetical protein